jgi:thiol-disulfide isomerase/thioredoxin
MTQRRSLDRGLPVSTPADVARLLASANRSAGHIVDGSITQRLSELAGVPVVVNAWASWCGPCRQEFPYFRRLARRYRAHVAFVGLNSEDSRGPARKFLRTFAVPYASLFDPEGDQVRQLGGGGPLPATFFYDHLGHQTYARLGAYTSASSLEADIRHFALGSGSG